MTRYNLEHHALFGDRVVYVRARSLYAEFYRQYVGLHPSKARRIAFRIQCGCFVLVGGLVGGLAIYDAIVAN